MRNISTFSGTQNDPFHVDASGMITLEMLTECSFTPIQLDPRSNATNPQVDFGVEITIAGYEHITNLDHHGPDDTSQTPSAAEQAMSCALPSSNATVATVRPDADSMTAMAVLHLRMLDIQFDTELVHEIGRFDRLGPSAGEMNHKVAAIWEIASDFSKDMQSRILTIAKVLIGKITADDINTLASKRQKKLIAAKENSEIHIEEQDGIKIAIVRSTHSFATNLGYSVAPIVVALNPSMLINPKESSQGTYKKYTICRYDDHVPCDISGILKELSELESGWGGRGDIIGSPQGVSSVLEMNTVLLIVKKHIKNTQINEHPTTGLMRTFSKGPIGKQHEVAQSILQIMEGGNQEKIPLIEGIIKDTLNSDSPQHASMKLIGELLRTCTGSEIDHIRESIEELSTHLLNKNIDYSLYFPFSYLSDDFKKSDGFIDTVSGFITKRIGGHTPGWDRYKPLLAESVYKKSIRTGIEQLLSDGNIYGFTELCNKNQIDIDGLQNDLDIWEAIKKGILKLLTIGDTNKIKSFIAIFDISQEAFTKIVGEYAFKTFFLPISLNSENKQ